jgi:hypothetical protein
MMRPRSRESVLFVTLDSCRFDTFAAAAAPRLRAIGPLHRAQAPSYYTHASHAAMFVGFTPGMAGIAQPILNPKAGKLFKLVGAGFAGIGANGYELRGRDIVEGFRNSGFATLGTGAVGWFDPRVPTGQHLTSSFDKFFYSGDPFSLRAQMKWLRREIESVEGDVFAFLNLGETHVPYWHEGAPWSRRDNPCIPFQSVDRSADCRARQLACLEFADAELAPLLEAFMGSTILACGDHGDCWGEDGLWEHGISHPATLTVPLMVRLRGEPIDVEPAPSEIDAADSSAGSAEPSEVSRAAPRSLMRRIAGRLSRRW